MTVPLPILQQGSCEPLKAVVHGTSMALCALMGLYNAAAWLNRRERHLAINAVIYGLGVAWERRLVSRHLRACQAHRTSLSSCKSLRPAA
jgi:hypothetical protein